MNYLKLLMLTAGLAGCAASGPNSSAAKPVLYPNAAYNRMGETRAQQAVQSCMARAEAAGLTPKEQGNAAARRASQGAATVGAAAAVGALVTGRDTEGVIRAGATGAAVGGTAGAVSGAMQDKPSSTYRQFVQRCLGEQGLDVIGWN